jgi:hypothetical protein
MLGISHDREKVPNFKLLLYMFELMSGLKINFLKGELFVVGRGNSISKFCSHLFNSQDGNSPMKYLGVPMTFANLTNMDWDFLDAKFLKKLESWICDAATSGARLTWLDACLSGISSYFMSTFLLSLTCIEKLNNHRQRFFWAGKKKKRKYHM